MKAVFIASCQVDERFKNLWDIILGTADRAVSVLEAFRGTGESPLTPPVHPSQTEAVIPSENLPFRGSYEKFYVPSDWLTRPRHPGVFGATIRSLSEARPPT